MFICFEIIAFFVKPFFPLTFSKLVFHQVIKAVKNLTFFRYKNVTKYNSQYELKKITPTYPKPTVSLFSRTTKFCMRIHPYTDRFHMWTPCYRVLLISFLLKSTILSESPNKNCIACSCLPGSFGVSPVLDPLSLNAMNLR